MPKIKSEEVKDMRNGGWTRIALPPLTPFRRHVISWDNCQRCSLAGQRNRVVFSRGVVPADVVFVGEAPGNMENSSGIAFDGPAGDLLNRMIREALELNIKEVEGFVRFPDDPRPVPRMAFNNIVSCFPAQAKRDGGPHQPPIEAIKACAPKLKEFLSICRPKFIVCVGGLAEKYIHLSADAANEGISFEHITHPSYILSRLPLAQKDLEVQKCVIRIRKGMLRAGIIEA